MLKVGLLGAGRIAGVHATAITTNPGSTLVAAPDKGEIGKAELLSLTSFDPAPPPVA